jgi:hypothetical protein
LGTPSTKELTRMINSVLGQKVLTEHQLVKTKRIGDGEQKWPKNTKMSF